MEYLSWKLFCIAKHFQVKFNRNRKQNDGFDFPGIETVLFVSVKDLQNLINT